jgi:hypothetical protein
MSCFTGVQVSTPTVRRVTDGSGVASVEVQTATVATIKRTWLAAPAGPPVQWLSLDVVMIPRIHKAGEALCPEERPPNPRPCTS